MVPATKYANVVLKDLPSPQLHCDQIRKLLHTELAQGRSDARNVARKLRMSVRTLGRRLEEEGTTYKLLLDEVRKDLAYSHLVRLDLSIPDVAYLLGFSDVTAFHRARRVPRGPALVAPSR
jgi:AraC-like DNA-binding protein